MFAVVFVLYYLDNVEQASKAMIDHDVVIATGLAALIAAVAIVFAVVMFRY